MKPPRPARRSGERGFTLVELIVALTILALIAAALFTALRFSARAWEAGEMRAVAASDAAAIRSFLRARLRSAQPATVSTGPRSEMVAFSGDEQSLRFAGPMPPEVGLGGLYLFTLEQPPGGPVMLDWRLIRPTGPIDIADGRRRPRRLFAAGIRVRFRYFGALEEGAEARWHFRWQAEKLPWLIELRFDRTGAGPPMPPLRVAPVMAAVSLGG